MMKHVPEDNVTAIIEKENMYRQIVEYTFETVIIHADHKILYINQSGADFFKASKEKIIGSDIVAVFQKDDQELIKERIRKASEENKIGELIELTVSRPDDTRVEVELYCHPVEFGDKRAIQSIVRDITTRKEAEKKLRQMMNEVASPIVPVSDGISVLPLVGVIDEDRAVQLLQLIPERVQGQNLNHLIIDFSGIYNFDTVTIEFLYKLNSVMKLLGISPICTGLRPELAQKAISTCKDVTSLVTMANVKQALNRLTGL